MAIPVLPSSAPFTQAQRAWLNGFFAGVLSFDTPAASDALLPVSGAPAEPPEAAATEAETYAWHDATLPLQQRLQLAEDKPLASRLMAAMAQLDCGSCGYDCKTYAEALARGDDRDVTKCTPGGRETSRALKQMLSETAAT